MKNIIILITTIFIANNAFACTEVSRAYGAAATFNLCLYDLDGVDFNEAATFAAGDITISKDEGTDTNCTTGSGVCATDEGKCYSIALTATEMEAARVLVAIKDQTATMAWLPTCLAVTTYGTAAGVQHDTTVAALEDNTITAASINADAITDAKVASGAFTTELNTMLTTARTQLTAVPGNSPSILDMLRLTYTNFKHKKTTTNSVYSVFQEDGTTVLGTQAISTDGTTTTRGVLTNP